MSSSSPINTPFIDIGLIRLVPFVADVDPLLASTAELVILLSINDDPFAPPILDWIVVLMIGGVVPML